jgi:hypothetical protein
VTPEEARKVKAGTKVMFDAQVWDFGYVGATGLCIIYVEGERNMQDSIGVEPELVELETVARERMARFAVENPTLPPGWEWHPWCDRDDVQVRWRALGPKIAGRRVEAYGTHQDTPGHAAEKAWEIWERLSGLTKKELDAYRQMEDQAVECLGGGEVRCNLCGSFDEGPERKDDRGPWHERYCLLWRENLAELA